MKIEDQVCSLELAKRLKELGVKQDSLFCWHDDTILEYLPSDIRNEKVCIAAFTVAELGEMLPESYKSEFISKSRLAIYKHHYGYYICYEGLDYEGWKKIMTIEFKEETEANARAKMLIWLIEQGHVKV